MSWRSGAVKDPGGADGKDRSRRGAVIIHDRRESRSTVGRQRIVAIDAKWKRFDHYGDVLEIIRDMAVHSGAEVPKRIARPVDGRVMFALPHAQDESIGFTLIKPTSIYRDVIMLSWKPYLLRKPSSEAIKLTLGKPEEYAQPLLVDFAIIGFNAYQRCSTLGEVANGVAAYIAASLEIVQRMPEQPARAS